MRQESGDLTVACDPALIAPSGNIELAAGTIVANNYRIEQKLGGGGMGVVYRCTDLSLNREVAMKFLLPDYVDQVTFVLRFQHEARAARRLSHPNIIKVHHFGVEGGPSPFIITEYVHGTSLDKLLAKEGSMDVRRCLKIMRQIADALAHAHSKNVIHRDLKPGNIVLTEGQEDVKILDFGIAKIDAPEEQSVKMTRTGEIFGSPAYMSPEQCMGRKVGPGTDQYSLGCVMFECLYGQAPFTSENTVDVMLQHIEREPPRLKQSLKGKSIPPEVERVVHKLLAKLPVDRFTTASEAGQAIDELLNPVPIWTRLVTRYRHQLSHSGWFRWLKRMTGELLVMAGILSDKHAWLMYILLILLGAALTVPLSWHIVNEAMMKSETANQQRLRQTMGVSDKVATFEVLPYPFSGCPDDPQEANATLRQTIAKDPQATTFAFAKSTISDEALPEITKLRDLKSLDLEQCQKLSDAAIARTIAGMKLRSLNLNFNNIGPETIKAVAKMSTLKELQLAAAPVGDRDMNLLSGLTQLERLNLAHTELTAKSCKWIKQMHALKDLNLSSDCLIGAGLTDLKHLKLESLNISLCDLANDNLAPVSDFKSLKCLDISGNMITDGGLESLKRLHGLKTLLLRNSRRLTPKAISALKKALPNCEITFSRRVIYNKQRNLLDQLY